MRNRSRSLSAVLAAALLATALVGVSAPPASAAVCAQPPPSGHWTGSGFSNVFMTPFTFEGTISYNDNGTIGGTVSVNFATPAVLNGTYDCAGNISFGSVLPSTSFTGTFLSGARSATGTYTTGGGDNGTWSDSADPYVLTATSTVQPTTIAPSGASGSWVIDVENTGTAASTLTDATFEITGAGTYGDLAQTSSVSQGTGCSPDNETPNLIHCDLGTILAGAKASAQITVVSTGGGGSSINVLGSAYSRIGGGTDDFAPSVTVNVVAPAALPTGSASGVAVPGVKFETSGGKQATVTNPIKVIFKLPKKVAAGTTGLALSKAAKLGKKKRSLDGVSLMSATAGKTSRQALGRPMIASVTGPTVPMSISRIASEASTFCGGQACSGDVIHLTSFKGYNDPKKPAKVTITWDKSKAGRGVGSAIFKRGDSTTSPTQTLGTCVKTKAGYLNTPCITKKRLVSGGDVQFTLYVLSGDPKFGRR